MSQIDIDYLQTWVGREQLISDDMSPFKATALSAALESDQDYRDFPAGETVLPPSWQWLYFLDTPGALSTGTDGHPKTGGFLPPVPLQRRMWAAGKYSCHADVTLGVPALKRSRIKSVELKQGSTGTLVFVTVLHTVTQQGQVCIEEEQNIVYREMPTAASPMPEGQAAPDEADWDDLVTPDPVLLFRYSALTFNGHRIHYDRDYAVNEEFYPALVVHGPLQATLLANSVRKHCPGSTIKQFSFRAQRPLFDTDRFSVCGKRSGNKVSLWTRSHDGFIGMTATAEVIGETQ